MRFGQITCVAACLLASAGAAQAQAEFYKGKSIRIIIGYGAGGGYDLYARMAAEFMGRHIPGNPVFVPQNMPGAGSFVAAKYLYSVAPKDGTALGMLVQSLPLDAATGRATGIDVTKMPYIGRLTSNIDLGIGKPGAKLSIEDARSREIKTASTGGASPAVLLPTALNTYAGTKFRLILGYRGIADSLLAVERGETDIAGAGGLASTLARHPSWIEKREAPILYQAALERHPAIPHVPTIVELANGDTGKAVMRALASTAVIGRSLISTPGVPAERIAILRKAFDAMVKDSAYLEAAKKRKVMLDPATGAQMDKVAQDTLAMPKDIAAKVAALLQPPKKK